MVALDKISFDLTDDERDVLRHGLMEWGGPARCTEELAIGMGFVSVLDLLTDGERIRAAIAVHAPLPVVDWARALLATEIVFASNLVGSGWDWSITSGRSDEETLTILRGLQKKLTATLRPVIGAGLGTRSVEYKAT
jgi:hypothetical protein